MTHFDFHDSKWKFFAAGFACLLGAFLLVNTFSGKFASEEKFEQIEGDEGIVASSSLKSEGAEETSALKPQNDEWAVYVTGAVKKPGVYLVHANSRVHHAVDAAGGFSSLADAEAINLAEYTSDGAHIKVPVKTAGDGNSGETSFAKNEKTTSSSSSKKVAAGNRVNINTASEGELLALPGIGPKTAESIVQDREKFGAFKDVDDLIRVKGIGEKKLESLREHVRVRD